MVNSQQVKEVIEGLRLDLNTEKIPQTIPTIETNPKQVGAGRTISQVLTNSAGPASLITSTSQWAPKDVYIRSAYLTLIKDASATSTLFALSYTDIDGASAALLRIDSIASTAETRSLSYTFPNPIRIKRGTAVTLSASNAVGEFKLTGGISFWADETNN